MKTLGLAYVSEDRILEAAEKVATGLPLTLEEVRNQLFEILSGGYAPIFDIDHHELDALVVRMVELRLMGRLDVRCEESLIVEMRATSSLVYTSQDRLDGIDALMRQPHGVL